MVGSVIAIAIIVVALLAILFLTINGMLVDRLWFESVGQLPVWDLRTFTRLLVWVPISLVVFVLLTTSDLAGHRQRRRAGAPGDPHPAVVPWLEPAGWPRPAQHGGDDPGAAADPRRCGAGCVAPGPGPGPHGRGPARGAAHRALHERGLADDAAVAAPGDAPRRWARRPRPRARRRDARGRLSRPRLRQAGLVLPVRPAVLSARRRTSSAACSTRSSCSRASHTWCWRAAR